MPRNTGLGPSLFQLATKQARRKARRSFAGTTIGQLAVQASSSSRKGRKQAKQLTRAMKAAGRGAGEIGEIVKELAVHGTVERYAAKKEGKSAIGRLFKALGPIGDILRGAFSPKGASGTEDLWDAAAELIRAFGGEVLTKPGQKGHERGLEAARQLVEQATQEKAPPPSVPEIPQPGDAEEWPEEHGIQLLGRGSIGYDQAATNRLIRKEIRTPQSSNVYSFVAESESRRTVILYVTFKAWSPGRGKSDGPGATYAYYDVPFSKYRRFAESTQSSAGGAVWDYLRQRGSVHGHQHPYRLVSGVLIQDAGEYVPRKATQRGLRSRTVAQHGMGKRGYTRSTLRPRLWGEAPNGAPNRGRPNRGQPPAGNRG